MTGIGTDMNDKMESKEIEKSHNVLNEVMTTKEIEKVYDLPVNTVLQDIRRGKVKFGQFRQSGRTWLITKKECDRLYHGYKRKKGKK